MSNASKKNRSDNILKKGISLFNLKSVDLYTINDLIEYSEINHPDDLEILTVILLIMFSSLNEKSLCIELGSISASKKISDLFDVPEKSNYITDYFIKNINNFSKIVSFDENDFKPLIYVKYKDANFLYFQKNYINERILERKIIEFLQNNKESQIDNGILNTLYNFPLDEKQKMAVYLAMLKNFVIISGGPGTGKTFIVFFILKLLLKSGFSHDKIKLLSPTGLASENLNYSIQKIIKNESDQKFKSDILKIESSTIHRILKYHPRKNTYYYNENCQLPLDVIIVDEVSMLDIELTFRLLSAADENCKIIFLGDKDQLPSVEAGSILSELIPENFIESFSTKTLDAFNPDTFASTNNILQDRIILLDKSYRTRGAVNLIAKKINAQDITLFDDFIIAKTNELSDFKENGSNFFFIESRNNINDFKVLLDNWIEKYYINTDYYSTLNKIKKIEINNITIQKHEDLFLNLFSIINSSKILTILNDGIHGSLYINNYINNFFIEKFNFPSKNQLSGIPVIINQNDYFLNLFNGEIGIIIYDQTPIKKIIFKKNDKFAVFNNDSIKSYNLSYAITVHKSQGSEFDDILLILPEDKNNPLLTKEIIYTSITRAKNNVYLYSSEGVLSESISKKVVRLSNMKIL